MEINRFSEVVGVIPTEDITEGRFVLQTPHTFTHDFGSREDVPGVKLPDTADEAKKAIYCLTWSPDNQAVPFYETMPQMDWAERGGWSLGTNMPLSATIYMTHHSSGPECQTIPSGTPCLGYTDGVFTLPSGCYVYSADIIKPGASLMVCDTASDGAPSAGKLKYSATVEVGTVGTTWEYDSDSGKLTVLIF
jgi:hypothetical protein